MPWPFTRKKSEAAPRLLDVFGPNQPAGFAFDLFRELNKRASSGNVFFSPASIRLCLSLLYDGARGELLGDANRGLQAMFVMMNEARIGVANQGLH